MKKNIILIVLNVLFVINSFSQSFYQDAMILDSLLRAPTLNYVEIKKIMKDNQLVVSWNVMTSDTLMNKFKSIEGLETISEVDVKLTEIQNEKDVFVIWDEISKLLHPVKNDLEINSSRIKVENEINSLNILLNKKNALADLYIEKKNSILDTLGDKIQDTVGLYQVREFLKKSESIDSDFITSNPFLNQNKELTQILADYKQNVVSIKKAEDIIRHEANKICKFLQDLDTGRAIISSKGNNHSTTARFIKPQIVKLPAYAGAKGVQSLAIPSESEIIDALAIFLVKRFKEEMALEFVGQIKNYLVDNPDIQIVFPNTWEKMKEIERFEQPDFGKDWQSAFAEDVISLPENIWNTSLVLNTASAEYENLFLIAKMIYEKKHITEIITLLNLKIIKSNKLTPMDSLISKFELMNKILYSNDSARYWIKFSELQGMTSSQFDIFVALIYGKYNNDIDKLGLRQLLSEPEKFKAILSKLLIEFNNLENMYVGLQNQILAAPQANFDYSTIWDNYSNIFKVIYELGANNVDNPNTELMLEIADHSFSIYSAIESGDYNEIITQSLDVLSLISKKEQPAKQINAIGFELMEDWVWNAAGCDNKCIENMPNKEEVHNIIGKCFIAKSRNQVECNPECKSHIYYELYLIIDDFNKNFNLDTFESQITKCFKHTGISDSLKISIYKSMEQYKIVIQNEDLVFSKLKDLSSFIGDAMYAQDSKELSEVIEAHAASPTSYKIKRYTKFSLDLSSYITLYIGNEWNAQKPFFHSVPSGVYGLSAIIGPSVSFGDRKKQSALYDNKYELYSNYKNELRFLNGFSHSISISIFDIGAVVSYRFSDTASGLPKDVNFAQVFSPGLHYMYGIRETPLTIAGGIQYTPLLRDINTEVGLDNTLRAYIGVSFDIPLFNFYYAPNFK